MIKRLFVIDRDNSLVHSTEHFILAIENKVFLYDETNCSFKGNKVFPLMKQTVCCSRKSRHGKVEKD
ncbi:hypothetical protein JCM16496A_13570 [Bacteroides rodentium JCM 16496]